MRTLAWTLPLGALLVGGFADAGKAKDLSGKLNLNTATVAELDLLPGVGPAMAERILAHRARQPFKRPEELVRVKGVGRKKYQRLAPYLTVSGPTTLAHGPPVTLTAETPAGPSPPALTASPTAQGRSPPPNR